MSEEDKNIYQQACEEDAAGNHEASFELFLEAVEMGHCGAQHDTGYCYYYGEGTEEDYDKSFHWFFQVANSNKIKVKIIYKNY